MEQFRGWKIRIKFRHEWFFPSFFRGKSYLLELIQGFFEYWKNEMSLIFIIAPWIRKIAFSYDIISVVMGVFIDDTHLDWSSTPNCCQELAGQ